MLPSLAVTLGLRLQAASSPLPARPPRVPDPVRLWRADSTVYVARREPGHLVLLHVDAIGRIRVLSPLDPYDDTAISGDAPVEISIPPEAQGNPSTFVAVRSRWPFDFAALQAGRPGITTMRCCCSRPRATRSRPCSTSPTASPTGVPTTTAS